MSVCSNAVGLLATVACVHIAITIILGVILGFVLYTSNRNKAAKRRKENERIVNAMLAAGRILSPTEYSEQDEAESVSNEEGGGAGCEGEAKEKLSLESERGDTVTNVWTDIKEPESKGDMDWLESLDKPVTLRRIRSPLQLRTVSPIARTGSPLTRTGSPLTRTGSPLTRTGSPLTRTESPISDLGKKARMSVISVASNLSSKFRKSVELSEEEAKLVFSMSPSAVVNDDEEEGDLETCYLVGDMAIPGEKKVEDRTTLHDYKSLQLDTAPADVSNTKLTLSLPWQSSESTC